MSFDSLLIQSDEVLSSTIVGTDGYNVPTRQQAVVATYPCRLQEELLSNTEDTSGRDTVAGEWKVFLPPTATLTPFDQHMIDGRLFETLGPPKPVMGASGLHHYEVRLREVIE